MIPSLEAIRDWCNENFTLKKASSSELGGIKVGSGLSIAQDGTLSTTKRFETLYNSGGLNAYAMAGSDVPFDLNWPDIHEINEFDELAIMMGFTDQTYSEENYLEARFNVRLWESYATNWKASAYKGINLTFNDDAANDERTIVFGLVYLNPSEDPQYCFRYSYSNSLTERLPGIRKIYGIKY